MTDYIKNSEFSFDNYSDEFEELIDDWDSFEILEGDAVEANYVEQIYIYKGNPFIEALGKIITEDEFYEKVTEYPEIPSDVNHRILNPEERIHLCMVVNDFFEPFSQHAHLQQHISRTIRERYRTHNPLDRGFRRKLKAVTKIMQRYVKDGLPEIELPVHKKDYKSPTKMLGSTLLGISGIGKTTAIEVILNLYPQVIYHRKYKLRKFTWTQVVYMKMDCPHDASIKGLCINFFIALDELLSSNYFETHARFGLATVDEMIPRMAHLAFVHSIGILIIDEIQRLNYWKSGGAPKVLSFFVQLINTVQMPVMLVGTPYARNVVSKHFRQIRRGAGSGKAYWENMAEDDEWDEFIKVMWRYQFTAIETELTTELSQALYYESAGIADLAVKLYIMAQTRTIRLGGDEIITEDIIRSVAYDALIDAQDMLKALRNKDYKTLEEYPDLMLVINDRMLHMQDLPLMDTARNTNKSKTNSSRIVQLRNEIELPDNATLVDMTQAGKKHNITAYEVLQEAHYIKSALEFLNDEIS